MANTLIFLQDNHYDSLEQLKQNYKKISTTYNSLQSERDSLTLDIIKLNKQLHYLYQYHTNKCYFIEMLNCQNKKEPQHQTVSGEDRNCLPEMRKRHCTA